MSHDEVVINPESVEHGKSKIVGCSRDDKKPRMQCTPPPPRQVSQIKPSCHVAWPTGACWDWRNTNILKADRWAVTNTFPSTGNEVCTTCLLFWMMLWLQSSFSSVTNSFSFSIRIRRQRNPDCDFAVHKLNLNYRVFFEPSTLDSLPALIIFS